MLLFAAAALGMSTGTPLCNASQTEFFSECEFPGDWTVQGRVSLFAGVVVRVAGNLTLTPDADLQMYVQSNGGSSSLSVFGFLTIEGGRFEWVAWSSADYVVSWSEFRAAIGAPQRPVGRFDRTSVRFLGIAPDACVQLSVFQSFMMDGFHALVFMNTEGCPPSGGGFPTGPVVFVIAFALLVVIVYVIIRRCNKKRDDELRKEAIMVEDGAFSDFADHAEN